MLPNESEPASIALVQGNDQSGRVGEPLPEPLVARVTDGRGRPVVNVPLQLTFDDGFDGAVLPATAQSDGEGSASFQVTLGTRVGTAAGQVAVVPASGDPAVTAPVRFTALSANAAGIAIAGGDGQTAPVGTPLAEPLVVQVADVFGNPIPGVPISWTTEGGGSVSESVVSTDADGRASVVRTLGPAAGEQRTLAGGEGLAGSPVAFTHTATAGSAARLEAVSGDGQSAVAGTPLAEELAVRLLDPEGNPVAGVAVAWVPAQGAGTVAPESTPTDAGGRAATGWTLGSQPGTQTVSAVVSGVGVVAFTATALPGTPPGLRLATQPAASARRGVVLARQPVVQLVDPSGLDIRQAGVPVTVAVAAGGGRARGTLTRTTGDDGRAAFTDLALEGPAGQYTLAFSAVGYTGVVSSPIALARATTTITITADTPDPSQPGASVRVAYAVASSGGRPGGSVTVTADDGATCRATVAAGACALALSQVGTRTITATYEGDAEFEAASDTEAHTVEVPPSPALAITTQPSERATSGVPFSRQPAVRLQDGAGNDLARPGVAITAGIGSGGGTLIGTVTRTTDAAGRATWDGLGITGTGPHTLRFTAEGFVPVASATVEVEAAVTISASASTVSVSPSSVAIGDPAGVDVVVRDAAGNAMSGVEVGISLAGLPGDISPASDRTSGSGLAQFTVRPGAAGTGTITAVAGGVTLDQRPVLTATRAASETRIESDQPDPSEAGEAVEVRVSVRGDGGTPGGQVQVSGTGGLQCTIALENGSGRCSVTPTSPGTITLQAEYAGDAAFGGSSDTEEHVVLASAARVLRLRTQPSGHATPGVPLDRQPEVQLALDNGQDVRESGVTVRAQVSGATLGGTTAVQTDGDGRARFTDLSLTGPDGSYSLTFTADGYAPVTSSPIDLRRATARVEITDDAPDPSEPGETFVVRFRVRGGATIPTGSVTVTGGGASCSGTLDGSGEGSCQLALPQEGDVALVPSYSGDERYAPSTGNDERHRVHAPSR